MRDQYPRKEVQAFIVASEHLYRLLEEGDSLSVCETEAILCCLDELLAQGSSRRNKLFWEMTTLCRHGTPPEHEKDDRSCTWIRRGSSH